MDAIYLSMVGSGLLSILLEKPTEDKLMNFELDYVGYDKFPVVFGIFTIFFITSEFTNQPCLAL